MKIGQTRQTFATSLTRKLRSKMPARPPKKFQLKAIEGISVRSSGHEVPGTALLVTRSVEPGTKGQWKITHKHSGVALKRTCWIDKSEAIKVAKRFWNLLDTQARQVWNNVKSGEKQLKQSATLVAIISLDRD